MELAPDMMAHIECGFTLEEIDAMSYRELQKKCKSNGIKANSKAAILRTSLRNSITQKLDVIDKSKPVEHEAEASAAVENATETSRICIELEMVDNTGEIKEVANGAAAAIKDITTSLAEVDISSEAATPTRTFGTELTTPTKTFIKSITTTDMLSSSKSFAMTPSGKIKCSYTGHEMPATAEAVATYMSGKKYRKAKVKAEFDIEEFHPWLVESKSAENPNQVWCTVTNRFVSRDAVIIRRHMAGKKFASMLAKLQNFQKLRGVPTPTGKRTVFNSPKNTPRSDPYTYNVHWSMEDYEAL